MVYESRGGHSRLMERPGDEPVTWRLQYGDPADDPSAPEVLARDVVDLQNDVPTHIGFEIQVELDAETLQGAIDEAVALAETSLIFFSAAARAPLRSVQILLAYDITPGVEERAFAQWFPNLPVEVGKQPVPHEPFGLFFTEIPKAEETLRERLVLSMSWHRLGVSQTSPIMRFLMLWIACEALTPRLADHYDVDASGFGGLRALATDMGQSASVVSEVLSLRRRLFHALRVTRAELEADARRLIPYVEDLLVGGWVRLLGRQDVEAAFPEASITPEPVHVIFRATLLHRDASVWRPGNHPHFVGEIGQQRRPTDDPRAVEFGFTSSLTLRNADAAQPLRIELRGPQGPRYQPMREPPPPLPGHDAAS